MKALLPILIALTGCAGLDTQAGEGDASRASMEARCASWAEVAEKHVNKAAQQLGQSAFWKEAGYAMGINAAYSAYYETSEKESAHRTYMENCGDRV
jgi:hypothetical protein